MEHLIFLLWYFQTNQNRYLNQLKPKDYSSVKPGFLMHRTESPMWASGLLTETVLWRAESSGIQPEVHGCFLQSGDCIKSKEGVRSSEIAVFLSFILPSSQLFSKLSLTYLRYVLNLDQKLTFQLKFAYAQIFFFTLLIKISATILNSKRKTNKLQTARHQYLKNFVSTSLSQGKSV